MQTSELLKPKIYCLFEEKYSFKKFYHDLIAGIIVGIVALPLAIAFGIASGVKPEQGLFTAIITGFLISLLSGSKVQIGGPTGAFIVIIHEIVQKFGYEGLAVSTMLAGVFLILMALARLGTIIQYIPYPVTIGFTSGIAVIIFTGQLKDALGLKIAVNPSEFLDKVHVYLQNIHTVNYSSVMICLITLAIILIGRKKLPRIPGSLIAVIFTSLLTLKFNLPIETIGSKFGSISSSLPKISFHLEYWGHYRELLLPAFSIALLAGIESLLSAVVADGMTGENHRPNMELLAQGIANLISPIFQGIPATGAIARTATNVRSGAQTPIAGIVHSVVLLGILLIFGTLTSYIPMACLAGILLYVAYNMSEFHMVVKLMRCPKSDIIVFITTFLLTVLVDLTVAIPVGMVLASMLFMKRMVSVSDALSSKDILDNPLIDEISLRDRNIPSDIEVFEIHGPFFFGAAEKFRRALNRYGKYPKVLIIRMRNVPAMDATGLHALELICEEITKKKVRLLFSGLKEQPHKVLEKSGFKDAHGEEHFFENIDLALEFAKRKI